MSVLDMIVWMIFGWLILWIGVRKCLKYYWTFNGVSYIAGPPLVGVISSVLLNKMSITQMFFALYNHSKTKEEAITGFYIFHKACLLVRKPELIRKILIGEFNQFPNRRMSSDPKSDPIGMHILFNAQGNTWKIIRQHIGPLFLTSYIGNVFPLLIEVCADLEGRITKEISTGSTKINLKELTEFYTTEAIASCAFGVKPNGFYGQFLRNCQRETEGLLHIIKRGTYFFLPEFAHFFGLKFFTGESNTFLRNSILAEMQEREKSGDNRDDLIAALIALRKAKKEIFHLDVLIAQAAAFLAADSCSSVLTFALYELAQHQDIQEKLRRELMQHQDELSYENFNKQQYLDMVFKGTIFMCAFNYSAETLRMYPGIPFLERTCQPPDGKKSYNLEPFTKFAIPRGMPIYIPVIAIQRDPKFFPDPHTFRPERFHYKGKPRINENLLLGFGGGPRKCIGSHFATLLIKMALATILPKYRVEFCNSTPKRISFSKKSILMCSDRPIFLTFKEI